MRLDEYTVKNGLAKSRERAKELIKNGNVSVNGVTVNKPSFNVDGGEDITVSGGLKYVGRGGLKLEKAIGAFGLDLSGKKCVDLGASTGGFTDCMLQYGASVVYAVDSGHGQLDGKLKSDSRVINMEGFNARNITAADIDGKADFLSCDLSFISLGLVIPNISEILKEDGDGVLLIKPQFECGRENIGKNGIVRSPKVHERVIEKVFAELSAAGLAAGECVYSPITGGSGNIEYLAHISFSDSPAPDTAAVVKSAFSNFRKGSM